MIMSTKKAVLCNENGFQAVLIFISVCFDKRLCIVFAYEKAESAICQICGNIAVRMNGETKVVSAE